MQRWVWPMVLCWIVLCTVCEHSTPPSRNTKNAQRRTSRTAEPRQWRYTDKTPEQWRALLRGENPRMRERAIDSLVQYGPDQIPPLIEILRDQRAGPGRLAAARALGAFGSKAESAVPALVDALGERSWPDRDGAAEALGLIRARLDLAVPALIRGLADEDPAVRVASARALKRMEVGEQRAVAALATALQDEDVNVQTEAAEALARLGPKAKSAIPALEKAARSPNFLLARSAREALRRIRGG